MKFIPSCLWKIFLLATALASNAQFVYVTNDGTITITGCACQGGGVEIPSMIEGLPVTGIGPSAFTDCPSPVGVTIPNTVTNIGDLAFYYCFGLTNITVDALNPAYASVAGVLFNKSLTTLILFPRNRAGDYAIPGSVTSIRSYAFSGSSGLANVTVPGSVIDIGNEAFSDCTGLTSVVVPSSVTNLGANAFANCAGLINVSMGSSVARIGDGAFSYCTSLPSVNIPSSVISIGWGAFSHCTSLSGIHIPDGVTNLEGEAFRECPNLSNVTLGDGITSIGFGSFLGCPGLTNLIIPSGVTNIDDLAFRDCTGFVSMNIPDGVTWIGGSSFEGCFNLRSIKIGNGLAGIGIRPFLFCNSLTNIDVDPLNSMYASIGGVLFEKDLATLLQCPAGRSGSYEIPGSVTAVGKEAFFYCTSLTNVTIPASVVSLGVRAFAYCVNVNGFFFKGNPPGLGGSYVFDSDYLATIYYPPETMDWGATYGDRPARLWNPLIEIGGSSFGVRSNCFGFNINGIPDTPIVVAVCTNLDNAAWRPLQALNLTNGLVYFCDVMWTNSSTRFYRIRPP